MSLAVSDTLAFNCSTVSVRPARVCSVSRLICCSERVSVSGMTESSGEKLQGVKLREHHRFLSHGSFCRPLTNARQSPHLTGHTGCGPMLDEPPRRITGQRRQPNKYVARASGDQIDWQEHAQ